MKRIIGAGALCLAMCINSVIGLAANANTTRSLANNGALRKETAFEPSFSTATVRFPSLDKNYAAGVTGAFCGVVSDKLLVAGGYNYPGNKFQEQTAKRYYKDVYVSTVNPKTNKLAWKKGGELPFAIANGAVVATEKALYIIGGSNHGGAKAACIEVKITANAVQCTQISWLPVTISDARAVCVDDYIYVVGGIHNGLPSSDVYRMHLKGDVRKWEKLPALPEDARIQPIVAAQKDADGKTKLYVWSGFNGWGKAAGLICGGYKYEPETRKWTGLGAPLKNDKRVYLGGGNAVPLGEDRIIAFGGFDYEILLNNLVKPAADYTRHEAEWYKHNQEVYCFNTKTNKWSCLGSLPELATVHAGCAQIGNVVYNISGELKPGTNTNIITKMSF